jgi:polyketide synthase PksL
LAQAWVDGLTIEWSVLYSSAKPQRIGLPTYPFAKERYWVQGAPQATAPKPATKPRSTVSPTNSEHSLQKILADVAASKIDHDAAVTAARKLLGLGVQ